MDQNPEHYHLNVFIQYVRSGIVQANLCGDNLKQHSAIPRFLSVSSPHDRHDGMYNTAPSQGHTLILTFTVSLPRLVSLVMVAAASTVNLSPTLVEFNRIGPLFGLISITFYR